MKSHREIQTADNGIYNVTYLISAPWAHPLWSQYLLCGYNIDVPEANKKRPDVTHEIMLWAVGPETKLENGPIYQVQTPKLLQPANMAYQLTTTNEKLVALLDSVVERIEAQTLSPDTDFRSMWDKFFITDHNAVTLMVSIFE